MFTRSGNIQSKGSFHFFSSLTLFAATLAFGVLLTLLAIVFPLGDVVNIYVSKAVGHNASWARDVVAAVFGLFLFFSYFAVISTAPISPHSGRGRGVLSLLALLFFILISSFIAGVLHIMLIKGETMFFFSRLMELKWELIFVVGLSLAGMFFPYWGCWGRPRLRWFACAVVIAIAMIAVVNPGRVRIEVGPWLQLGEDGAISVGWITDKPSTGWVEYGDELKLRARASRHGLVDAGTRVHHVVLTGLTPGANVSYRVAARRTKTFGPVGSAQGLEIYSERHAFTAPNPAGDSMTFAMFCDLHDAVDLWPDIMEKADARHKDFVVFNGDALSEVNDEQQLIDHFLEPASKLFAAETPFLFTRGNHEARGNFARELEKYIGIPGANPYDGLFRIGPVAFLALDTGEDKSDDHPEYGGLIDFTGWRAEQQSLIGPLTSGAEWKDASFRVLLAHIPLRDDHEWMSALNDAGVELQLAGHEHRLEYREPKGPRTFPILIGSGDIRKSSTKYNFTIGKATKAELAIDVVSFSGEIVGHYTYQSKR